MLSSFARALAPLALAIATAAPAQAAASPTAIKCAAALQPSSGIQPSVASGYTWAVVATGLTRPRSLQFDSQDNLWVLESGKGVTKHTLEDAGGVCVSVRESATVVDDPALNHGMVIDGARIFVSSSNIVYSLSLDAAAAAVVPNSNKTLVTDMDGTDHTTRTLLLASGTNNSLIVSRGSFENVDLEAANAASGHSTVKMFDIGNVGAKPFVHNSSGTLLGWGLRNDVGIAQHPTTGGLFAVENSVDQLSRDGQDIHQDNPGEELNFLGFVGGEDPAGEGLDFGYPYCYTAWSVDDMPNNANLHVGSPFSPQSSNDSACAKTEAPRLTFQAHMAPIDMKFNNSATEAWISFRGSWNRDTPVGYSVAVVSFKECGMPTEPPNSTKAANFIFANADNTKCPDSCFRPTGLAFDSKGRLFVASDASGEVYVLAKDATSNGTSGGASGSGSEGTRQVSGWMIAVITAICIVAALI